MDSNEMLNNAERIAEEDLRDRVVAGIAVLDQAVKDGLLDADWPDRIDPIELSMGSVRSCVIGQLYRHRAKPTVDPYQAGLSIIDGDAQSNPSRYGFDTGGGAFGYDDLDEAWTIALGADQ